MEFGGSPIFCQFGDEPSPFHFGFQPASTISQKFQAASNPQRQPENIIPNFIATFNFQAASPSLLPTLRLHRRHRAIQLRPVHFAQQSLLRAAFG